MRKVLADRWDQFGRAVREVFRMSRMEWSRWKSKARQNWDVLLALAIVAMGIGLFVALASEMHEGDTQALDEQLVKAMRSSADLGVPLGPPWVAEMARDITALGGYAVLILMTITVTGFLFLDRKFGAMWFLLSSIVSGYLIGMGLKTLFSRPRPDVVPHLSEFHTSSFPSGHSMMSAIVYLTLGALLSRFTPNSLMKLYFFAVAVLLTGLVGCSRVYLGVHYPTDVLAGWSAGMAWAMTCWLVARHLQRTGTLEKEL